MMRNQQLTRILAGLFLALALVEGADAQSADGRPPSTCESARPSAQTTGVIFEIEAKAYARVETLRTKLLDVQMQEIELQSRLDDLEFWSTPEGVQRAVAFVGTIRPMDEVRQAFRTRLEGEKERVKRQLELLTANRDRLAAAIQEAEADLERIRQRLATVQE